MKILLSNDDGYQAPGLVCLYKVLAQNADVTIVAPDRDRSGASNSLTLDTPIRAVATENHIYRVEGTPTDCVHLAITGLLEYEPDMVISGINEGANMGDDVLYSGTVAAATEGRFLGYPAIAVSLAHTVHPVSAAPAQVSYHFDTAAEVVKKLIAHLQDKPLPRDTILNVNVPDVPWQDITGFETTRLGHRHKSEPVIKDTDPKGRIIYWIGPAGPEEDAGPGTDFYAVRSNRVSITPLHVDLTCYAAMDKVKQWLEEI